MTPTVMEAILISFQLLSMFVNTLLKHFAGVLHWSVQVNVWLAKSELNSPLSHYEEVISIHLKIPPFCSIYTVQIIIASICVNSCNEGISQETMTSSAMNAMCNFISQVHA